MKITISCMALVALLIITSLTTAQDQNRSLSGSADFGDAGRHMGVTSLGTITITGDDVAADQAHVIRIAGNGFAYLPNGIVLRNPNAGEVAFDGPNQSHNLEVFFLGTGSQNTGGAYDVDVSLPAANSFVNGNGDSVVAYGGNWFGSAEYNKLDGSSRIFTADDLSNTDNSISPLTLMVAPDKAHASSIFNRTDSPRPEIPTTIQDPNSPLDFNLKFGQTPLLERQNTLFQVDAPAEGVAAPVLDLSQISVKAQGTSLRDRALNGQIIDLGRSIATNDSSTETINRTDNVVVTTFGDDDLRTRLSLSNFVESADGLTATLDQTQVFNSADSEATIQLQANFDINRSETGTFLKTVDVGNHISGEGLDGENAQSSLGVGYQYGVVEENGAVSKDVTVFALDGDTAAGTTITNFSAAKEFSRNTHTDIQVNNQAILDGTAQQTVSLSKNNGITGEGLVGEEVTATTQYDIHRVSVASSQIQSNAGLIGEGNIELENMRADGAGREAEAILIDGQRVGSTRWTVDFGGWDSRLSAGESVELTTAFDGSGLPEDATLGRNFRTRVDLTFQDGSFDLDAWVVGDSDVARVNSESTFDIVGSDSTRQTHSWLLEKTNEVTGTTGSTQLAAGTSLRDEGLNLTNTADNSSGEQTTLTLLDSGRLSGPRDVLVEFTHKNDASQTLSNASGFEGLISDIVNLTGLDGFMHVVELSYDPALLPGGSQAIVSWFDEGAPDAWVNATLGNSNIDSYDLLANQVIIDGNTLFLDEYLEGNRFEASYSEYLLSLAPSDAPVLGAFGFDEERLTAWAVIDHNSSFSTASISAVPEPSSMVALLSTLPWLLRRRRAAN